MNNKKNTFTKSLIITIQSLWLALSLLATSELIIQLIWGRQSKAIEYCIYYGLKILLLTGAQFLAIKFLKKKYQIENTNIIKKIVKGIVAILLGILLFVIFVFLIFLRLMVLGRG